MTAAIELPSPNHADRPAHRPVDTLILHYTELPLAESLAILRDATRPLRVSAHYVLAEDGQAYRLVREDRVAWHAGLSWWRGQERLNESSVGIEIVNLHGDRHDYPERQIEALAGLCRGILQRHPAIAARNVVGHSDVAPTRKIDPGRRFPWRRLAEAGIGLWPRPGAAPFDGDVRAGLQRLGYQPDLRIATGEIVAAFQRHFRPRRVDGEADAETRALLADLLDQVGNAP